jgi:hypothetical protein
MRAAHVLTAVVSIGCLAACSGSSEQGGAVPSTASIAATAGTVTTTATTTTVRATTLPPKDATAMAFDEVQAAYDKFSRERLSLLQNPVVDDVRINAIAVDPYRAILRDRLASYVQEGLAVRFPSPSTTREWSRVTGVGDEAADVEQCLIDDSFLVTVATGQRAKEGAATLFRAVRMKRVKGEWKVSDYDVLDKWEGIAGCAAGRQ